MCSELADAVVNNADSLHSSAVDGIWFMYINLINKFCEGMTEQQKANLAA